MRAHSSRRPALLRLGDDADCPPPLPPFAPLPRRYEQLVDWRYVALWWTEGDVAAARDPRALLRALPAADSPAAALRRQNVCRVHERLFNSERARVDALFRAALKFARERAPPLYAPPPPTAPAACEHYQQMDLAPPAPAPAGALATSAEARAAAEAAPSSEPHN